MKAIILFSSLKNSQLYFCYFPQGPTEHKVCPGMDFIGQAEGWTPAGVPRWLQAAQGDPNWVVMACGLILVIGLAAWAYMARTKEGSKPPQRLEHCCRHSLPLTFLFIGITFFIARKYWICLVPCLFSWWILYSAGIFGFTSIFGILLGIFGFTI